MKIPEILETCALAAILAFSAVSCSHRAKYVIAETPLNFSLAERGVAHLTVAAKPEDDRVYYTYYLVEKSVYESSSMTQEQYMRFVLDSLKTGYKEMVELVDPEHKEKYTASFADYALYYGGSSHRFTQLFPGTDYVVLGFCVNPETIEPVGSLHTAFFKTLSMEECLESDMKFDFMILDVMDKDNQETRVYFKPTSSAGTISKDVYLADVVSKDTLDMKYGGDIGAYVTEYLDRYSDLLDYLLCSDISEAVYDHILEYMQEGKEYVAWAAPYSMDYLEKTGTLTFTFAEGMRIDYTHDQK